MISIGPSLTLCLIPICLMSSLTNTTDPYYSPYIPAYIIFPHILAIGLLSMSILLLSTCGIFLFRVCMWSEERRRERQQVAEQELQTATALSMIDALESGSYEVIMNRHPIHMPPAASAYCPAPSPGACPAALPWVFAC